MLESETYSIPSQARDLREPDMAFLLVQHPDEIVTNLTLSTAEKRESLASWASDERTVVGSPALRQLPSGAIVRLYDIQRALRSLDRKSASAQGRMAHEMTSGGGAAWLGG